MPATAFRFVSRKTANRLVAGVPAAARLARSFAEARPGEPLVLAIGGDSWLSATTKAEIARLAPRLQVHVVGELEALTIPAEAIPDAATIAILGDGRGTVPLSPLDAVKALDQTARAIIRATAKPADGVVSRHLNRPMSQRLSAVLLRCPRVRPEHGTALTALVAGVMFACLLTGTPLGLIGGAILFQVASVADGIDGEIARATFRTSKRGASLDSITDGLTNCGFLLGVAINYSMQSRPIDASVSFASALIMGTGLVILGRHAARHDGFVHFDGIKRAYTARETFGSSWLKDITSRDFYCFFLLAMALAGTLPLALKIFLIAVTVWLILTLKTLRSGLDQ